jgi:predicted CxxxxCH...CXXCH cytochrome family protein
MDGGISSVSCFTAARSGINCHPDGPSGHPVGFLAPSAHGAAAKAMLAGRDGIAHCQVCHGLDYAGGKVNISCLNSAGCHGANVTAPHSPKPWRSSIGGRTHTTTDASNAAGCASCHSGGANSSRKPSSTPPAGTAPGCFNNTLCHGVIGHETGWKAASKHGVAAKAVASGDEGLNACSYCHGAQYDGGTAEQSCLTTNGCHGVKAPHPAKPWRSAAGLTHVSTDTSNAAQCATCHTGGANSDRKPRASDPKGLTGCFDNTLCHGTSGHEAGWNAPAQHGAVAKAAPSTTTGFSSCQPCHGAPFINGAAPTCFNSAVCHGSGVNAPHPKKPWFSASGGLTHTTTNPANAGTCAICHTAGANSTIKPPAPATLTLAGCFNNTLCHFHQIPYAPSASIPASLHGNEAKKDLTVCQTCHGNRGTTAFDGITLADGSKTTACSSCHTFAKAHATDWQGSGSYSHRTAGNRADACSLCHDVTQGRTAPLATAPSCFSVAFTNGLGQARACHPAGPGVTPHGVPYNNHNATARSNFSYCLTCHQNAVITSKPPGCRNCHLLDPVVNANNCISCHANPPAGSGYPNVAGSHASHAVMNVANICEACHSGLGLGTVDHLNRARARSSAVQANPVSFGTLARTGGLNPSYSASTRACTNTYCHGASLAGGSNKAPQWGQAGYNQGCGTCHGFPPNNTAHSGFTNTTPCAGCHTHVNSSNSGFTVPSKHINGSIDATIGAAPHAVPYPGHTNAATCLACHQVAATAANVIPPGCQNCHLTSPLTTPSGCTSCHASPPNGTGYPNVARAHAAHGSASKVAVTSLSCADCHTALGAGTVDHQLRAKARTATGRNNPVVFSSGPLLVLGGGTPPAYIDSNGQCTNVYCHGAKMAGGDTTGSNRTPAWDASLLPATISAAACGACHGFPPSTASGHPGGINIPAGFPAASIGSTCSCHANINTGGNSYANIFVNKALHINGIFEPVVAGGAPHPTPYPGSQHLGVGNGYVAPCGGCHDYTNSGNYPAAAGAPPNCRSCHTASLAAGCADCHGDAATGRPSVNSTQQSAFPTRMGKHLISSHSSRACTVCHPFTTGDARHGWSNNQTSTVAQVGGSGTSISSWNHAGDSCTPTCHGPQPWYGTPVSGTPHAMPNPGATHRVVGSGYVAACGGCHDYTNTGTYPATAGTPPNCRSCHLAGLGNGCSDCHGDAATGRPSVNSTAQSSFPTRRGQHQRSDHVNRACTACHPFTTGDARHGWSNRQKSTEAQVGGSGTNIRTWNTTTNTCTATCHGSENWY